MLVVGYSKSEIGGMLGISRNAVYLRLKGGYALPNPGVRIGDRVGWTREQVLMWDKNFREKSGK